MAERLYRHRNGRTFRFHGILRLLLRQAQGWRLDATRLVDLLGHLEGRVEFTDAVLLHELVTLGFFLGSVCASAR